MREIDNNWPKDYLPYFAWEKRVGLDLNTLYQKKQVLLKKQLDIAKQKEAALLNLTGKEVAFAAEAQERLVESKNISFEELLGLNLGDITTGTNAGLAGQLSIGQAPKYFKERSKIDWQEKASSYTKVLERILEDLYKGLSVISKNEIEAYVLAKYVQGQPLTKEEQQIKKRVLARNGGVVKSKDSMKVINLLRQYEANLMRLKSLAIGKEKNVEMQRKLIDIANTSRKILSELGYLTAEIATAEGFERAFAEIFKVEQGNIKAYVEGRSNIEVIYDPDYKAFFGDPPSSGGKVQRKGDVIIRSGEKGIEFEFGVSVKKTTQKSVNFYGLSIMTTSFALILSRSGLLNDTFLTDIMKIATAHSVNSYSNYFLKGQEKNILGEETLQNQWYHIKEYVSSAAMLEFLAGGMNENPPVLFLVINNKPYLISDIITQIMMNINASERTSVIDVQAVTKGDSSQRDAYSNLNVFEAPSDALSVSAGIRRSEKLKAKLTQTWKSQTVSISLRNILPALKGI